MSSDKNIAAMSCLIGVVQELSHARDIDRVIAIVRDAARSLTGADGATFILRDGNQCYYIEENAIAPLWRGKRFPMEACVSGWVMNNATAATIEDIYNDPRVPQEAYRPTFVKSMAVVPIRQKTPIGAIGNYWATRHQPTEEEVNILQALADTTSVALENVDLYGQLQSKIHMLEEQQQALKEADRRKDEFLAMLAHELRNPLAPVSNALNILHSRNVGENTAVAALKIATRQISHMARLLDDLLDMSRITSGKISLHSACIDLREAINQAVESARPLMEERRHIFEAQLPEQPVWVVGDATRLMQLFGNLLNNAAKYTNDGGRIVLDARQEADRAVVSVKDNGIGIAADKLPYIFDMFMQADNSMGRSHGGLGIGLTLVKSIAELHRGSVEARSGADGTEFFVYLPLVASLPAKNNKDNEAADAKAKAYRVLVVDDNKESADTLCWMMEAMGYEVERAYSGKAALSVVDRYKPQVILLDIGMPEMDGYELCRELRKDRSLQNAIYIAQTGWGDEKHVQQAKQAGFNFHLTKPINLGALQEHLATLAS